jgi:site-specific recombinase XerD
MDKSNKGRKFPAEVLTADEVQRLLKACSHKAPTGVRNRAIIALGYRSGLRLFEVLSLAPKDIDIQQGFLNIRHGKGNKSRIVGLDAGTLSLVQNWLDCRSNLGIGSRKLLFSTLQGQPLKTAYIRCLMPRLAEKAGIEKRVHFHGLRHTFAFELSKEKVAVMEIQNALGHSNLGVTSRYLNHLAPIEQIETVRNRTW